LAFVADFGKQNFNLKTKFDMENKTSINHENDNDANRLLAAVVPPQSEVDYSKVKQTCLCGVSVNLCDKVIMPDYGKRCPCVVSHYNGS
jgi:hypothetical protein